MVGDWKRGIPLAVVLVVVLAGCSALVPGNGGGSTPAGPTTADASGTDPSGTDRGAATTGAAPATTAGTPGETTAGIAGTTTGPPDARADPESDELGWENGYWYDEPIDVDATDGLTDAELRRLTARAMARIERIRGVEYRRNVTVSIRTPGEVEFDYADYLEAVTGTPGVWEATFVVGENATPRERFPTDATPDAFVSEPGSVVLVQSDTDLVTRPPEVLVHELVHTLQLQHPRRFRPGYGETMDGRLAYFAMREGEAAYVQAAYERRCRAGEWDCPDGWASEDDFDAGAYPERSVKPATLAATYFLYLPYAEGEEFFRDLVERGGWSLAERAYTGIESSEQLIHPGRFPGDPPASVNVADRSGPGWSREEYAGAPVGERLGEGAIYVLFWRHGVIPYSDLGTDDTLGYPSFDYSHSITDGWEGDRFVPYENGTEAGYVWKTRWESVEDAREFARAYRDLLEKRGARRVGGDTYRIPQGDPFADAFRLDVDGETVTVVNAPRVADLDGVRGDAPGNGTG